jgi:hypothetical protein
LSHLHVSPDAPLALRAAVDAVLVLHVGGGGLGIASGAVALSARKGSPLHRRAGQLFFGSMLVMSAIGAVVSPMLHDRVSGGMGAFTFYLTLTGWLTARRPPARSGRLETVAAVLGFGVAALMAWLVGVGLQSPGGMVDSEQPYAIAAIAGALALLAAGLDVRMVRRGGLAGPARLRRHLWRLCLAFFVASGSFFLGQQKVMPQPIQGSPVLFVLALAPLAALVFWLVRTSLPRRRRPAPAIA